MKAAKKVTTVKYHSTIGLNVEIPGQPTPRLVRIAHDKMSDGTWKVYVESGHNLGVLRTLGVKTLSDEEIQPLFDDNNVQEFRNLASLFGINV